MDNLSGLFKKEHTGQLVLLVLFVVYLVMGYDTPEPIAGLVDTLVGKIVIFIVVIYMFLHSNPILAVLSLFVAFDLIRRSSTNGDMSMDSLKQYEPTEKKKKSQFNAYNQFPYTLEQEVVSKMAPAKNSGSAITKPSFKPLLNNLNHASLVNSTN
jgi:hypothetical protein